MSKTDTTLPSVDELAAVIHDAKIRYCWDKTAWADRRAKEPWAKPNRASPNQPWHDVAIAQAEAVLEALNG